MEVVEMGLETEMGQETVALVIDSENLWEIETREMFFILHFYASTHIYSVSTAIYSTHELQQFTWE